MDVTTQAVDASVPREAIVVSIPLYYQLSVTGYNVSDSNNDRPTILQATVYIHLGHNIKTVI